MLGCPSVRSAPAAKTEAEVEAEAEAEVEVEVEAEAEAEDRAEAERERGREESNSGVWDGKANGDIGCPLPPSRTADDDREEAEGRAVCATGREGSVLMQTEAEECDAGVSV